MPLYEYACQKCDHEFEQLVQPGEKAECPKCESSKLTKLLSTPPAREERRHENGVQLRRAAVWAGLLAVLLIDFLHRWWHMRIANVLLFLSALFGSAIASFDPTDEERADGFVPVFNGKDLAGWKIRASKEANWIVEDGMLVCTGKGSGWVGTEKEYANFELRLQYRLPAAGNSGVYLRAPGEGWISRLGMEIQLLDDEHPKYAKLDFYQYTGALYHVMAPQLRASKPAGQWNDMSIRLDGRRLAVRLNGKQLQSTDLDACLKDPVIAKEHPGLTRTKGYIGLQNHHDRVEFRNVRVKELP